MSNELKSEVEIEQKYYTSQNFYIQRNRKIFLNFNTTLNQTTTSSTSHDDESQNPTIIHPLVPRLRQRRHLHEAAPPRRRAWTSPELRARRTARTVDYCTPRVHRPSRRCTIIMTGQSCQRRRGTVRSWRRLRGCRTRWPSTRSTSMD